ncbi:conjugal transfer protein [Antarcticibacterium flavum]|uniref:Conjugal transfer protein n=1 Tax=Antarcticibacterium flavum TaxID=2058175 RepID=A0A5B7X8H8_9FLAO|nr:MULTISPECIES: conjugal transfer protein [Antarcticibacterium]MCM4160867.1 conjugal transfer protein [Antarcticibacterium sp. W02-3]QCY71092.1 conjugal transfer protein [Antarcticibacterium flavum]
MKTKLIFLGIALLLSVNVRAQGMPVYDNTNFISLAKSLIESAKQTSQLLKTVEFLKTQKENIERVNDVIKQFNAVRELTRNNQILFEVIRDDLKEILNSPYIKPEEITRISHSFNLIIEQSLEDLDFIDQILTSNFLKMTDAERALVLKEKELQSREMVAEIHQKTRRYRDIISFREMQDKVNNRKINY